MPLTEHDTFAEPPERREAFNRYARMEPRSLRRLAAELKIAKSTIEQWSVDGKWQERIERWDIAAAVGDYEQWIKEARERREEKQLVAQSVLLKALQGLRHYPPMRSRPAMWFASCGWQTIFSTRWSRMAARSTLTTSRP